jgi:nucleotide-binding universal stress UspA family protein
MFRTIVVGYDGPDRGGDAVALAETLCDPRHGKLILTAAHPPVAPVAAGPFVLPVDYSGDTEAMLALARAELEGRVPVSSRAIGLSPPRALTEVAEEEHADLVVIGSTHQGSVGRVVPGTTADRLLTGAPCAVAVAPRGYEHGTVRHVGVAYDGSPEAEAALRAAEALALELDAELSCYCVVEPPPVTSSVIAAGTGSEWPSVTAKEHARQLLYYVADHAPRGLKPETLTLHGHAADAICRRATADAVDLLFAGSRGYGPLHRALAGSVSGALVRDAGCPVVVMPRSAVAARRAPITSEAANA